MRTINVFEPGEIVYWIGLGDGNDVPVSDTVLSAEVTNNSVKYKLADYGHIMHEDIFATKDDCEKEIVSNVLKHIATIVNANKTLLMRYGVSVEIIKAPLDNTNKQEK